MKVDHKAIEEDPALRRGLYGLLELARYVSFGEDEPISPVTVKRWVQHGLSDVKHQPRRPDYSFVDLISMLVVRNLVHLGLSLREVRETESFFRMQFGHEHPFVNMRLRTDGVDVFYDASPTIAYQLTAANRWGQEVLMPAITGALKGVTYEHELAISWSPWRGVVLDPTVQFGEPCIANTRVPTEQIVEALRSSELEPPEVARMYRVEERDVRHAVEFEEKLLVAA